MNTDMNILARMLAIEIAAALKAEMNKLASPSVQPALLSVRQAALYIGRSEQALQHLIFQKEFPVVRNGRRVHLNRRDLDGWIARNKQ
jgi:excisionase family DNA binding protein